MNRFLAITVILLLSIFTPSVDHHSIDVSTDPNHYILDNSISDNVLPFDVDHDKYKSFVSSILIIFVNILIISWTTKHVTSNHRRFIYLTPIFYQSNYVDTSLLKKS
jgi:hypothetical protein